MGVCLLMKLNRSPAANVPFVEVLPVAPRSLLLWSSVGSSFEFILPAFAHEPFNQGHVFLSVSLVDVMLLEVTEDHRPRRVDAGRCEALLRLTAHVGDMDPGLGAEIRDLLVIPVPLIGYSCIYSPWRQSIYIVFSGNTCVARRKKWDSSRLLTLGTRGEYKPDKFKCRKIVTVVLCARLYG